MIHRISSLLMLNTKQAKIDMLNNQTDALLTTLEKVLEIDKDDLELKIGAELEFYIVDKNGEKLSEKFDCKSQFIKNIVSLLMLYDNKFDDEKKDKNGKLRIESFEEEDGYNQFEVQFLPTNNPLQIAENINNFKEAIKKFVDVDFRAKPYKDEPSSSLHFHISVYYNGNNLFAKENPYDDDEYHYLPLYWSIAGMLELMPKFIKVFAPTDNCKTRYYLPKRDEKFIHYPTHICWGFNNRTCAIRIPKKPMEDPLNCRIEHRISSSMADPYLVLFAIFCGMQYGIAQELECPEPVFGRAYEDENAGIKIIDLF